MLYLFGTGAYKGDRKALKVGYTDDKKTREQHYNLHNPMGIFLGWRDGDELLELKLHIRLRDFKVEFLDEWFFNEPEVEEIFGQPENEIDKWLWENRTEYLLSEGIPKEGTMKARILDDLRSKFNGMILGEKAL